MNSKINKFFRHGFQLDFYHATPICPDPEYRLIRSPWPFRNRARLFSVNSKNSYRLIAIDDDRIDSVTYKGADRILFLKKETKTVSGLGAVRLQAELVIDGKSITLYSLI